MTDKQKKEFFSKQFKRQWLTQGLNGVHLYLSTTAESGHRMKKFLGFNYSPFLFYYKNNYAEGSYDASDFDRLWLIVRSRINRDREYLSKIIKKYHAIFAGHETWFKNIRSISVEKQSDIRLKRNIQKAGHCLIDSMNLSHVIEIISIGLESDLKKQLVINHQDVSANKILSSLTNIYKPSFINLEEQELRRIKLLSPDLRQPYLSRHAKKYYWFNTNYIGSRVADEKYFLKRLEGLTKSKSAITTNASAGLAWIAKSREVKEIIKMIRATAAWQDQRKVNIFQAIYHAEILIKELSRRIKISVDDLHYLAVKELLNLGEIKELSKLKSDLMIRRRGCFQWLGLNKEIIASGSLFIGLEAKYHSIRQRVGSTPLSIEGTTANSGRATGTVIICRSIKDLAKVRKGNILVTSMTRPEYLSGIKKAAALVTDEGGITCHAAIVSRELGLPCIIGTKIATKALKTGDMVEVNADHGVIKIIKYETRKK